MMVTEVCSGSGAPPAGQPRPGDRQHAGRGKQGPGLRQVSSLRQGQSTENAKTKFRG